MPEKDPSPGIEFKPIHLIPRNPFSKNGYITINDDNSPFVTEELNTGSRNDKKLKSSKYKLWASTGIVASILLYILVVVLYGKDKIRESMIRITAFRQVTHPETPSPLWGVAVKPFPTGAFWTNLVVKNGDLPVGVYPYGVKTTDAGVQVSYGASRRAVSR